MKTHWKKLQNPDYFGAWALDGKDLDVTIERVQLEQVTGTDGKREELPVAYLNGQKPLILNATNSKMIAKVVGSSYIEDWFGKRITLYSTKVSAFGQTVDAVRVRSVAPKAVAIDYDKIATAIQAGKASVEQAVEKYPDIDVERLKGMVK